MSIVLRFDGASKGNPGLGGSAGVIYKDNQMIHFCYYFHPKRVTNNVAEYYGLLGGLYSCLQLGYTNIMVEGDSKLVIEQVFGTWNCKDKKMIALCAKAKELKKKFVSIFGKWIPREDNSKADHYSNIAVQNKTSYNWIPFQVEDNPPIKQKTILEAFNNARGT
jgi:ribonuclease HI